MKTKGLVYGVAFLVAVLAGVCSSANDKEKYGFYIPKPNEEMEPGSTKNIPELFRLNIKNGSSVFGAMLNSIII